MALLFILSYVSFFLQISFVTVSIAAGLYYVAELVEEYTVIAKRSIICIISAVTFIQALFVFFDQLPWSLVLCGLASQMLHGLIMKNFPYVQFMSIPFLGALVLLIVEHYLAFSFFESKYYTFAEVLAYFTICLWLVPFALFVSLSANDNVLPTVAERQPLLINDNDVVTNYFSSKGKKLSLLSFFNYMKEMVLPQRNKKSF